MYIRTFGASELKRLAADNPHITLIYLVGGLPCPDLSGLNVDKVGLAGARSSLLGEMIRIEGVAEQLWPGAKLESLWENVGSMTEKDRTLISQLKGRLPLFSSPEGLWPMRRPRFY